MSADRYEITDAGPQVLIDGLDISQRANSTVRAAIRQQARDLEQLRTDLAAAVAERDRLLKLRNTCERCDGTGDVHTPTGEWRGECDCVYAQNNKMRARLAAIDSAPTVTYLYKFPYMNGFVWRHSQLEFNGARAVDSMELIARPAKD